MLFKAVDCKKRKKKLQCDTPIFVVAQKIIVFEKFSQQLLITKVLQT